MLVKGPKSPYLDKKAARTLNGSKSWETACNDKGGGARSPSRDDDTSRGVTRIGISICNNTRHRRIQLMGILKLVIPMEKV